MNTFKKLFFSTIMVISILAFSPTASHAIIGIGGVGDLGSFTGTLEYSASDDSNATVEIFLENTSSDGFLTAFAFDSSSSFSSVDLTTSPTDFDFLLEGINVAPFGTRDIGAGVGDSWLGGGDPNEGIADGDDGTFLFTFEGTGLNGLSDSDFDNFIVRFKGFDDEPGSDKVTDGCEGSCDVIPEPATMVLFGSGLLGGIFARRKKLS